MKKVLGHVAMAWVLCFSFKILPAPLQAAPPETINASYGAISGTMAPIWVAKEARLFEKQGLDLNLFIFQAGRAALCRCLAPACNLSIIRACRRWRRTNEAQIRR